MQDDGAAWTRAVAPAERGRDGELVRDDSAGDTTGGDVGFNVMGFRDGRGVAKAFWRKC